MAISKPESNITPFYANCNIFITGASGFLGKVLAEKLLRSCPEVAGIYLLIRKKKGFDEKQRLATLTENSIFDVLRIQQPNFARKLHPILGDIECEGLSLQSADREFLIKNIDIVFHVAATVRFNEVLRRAVNMNIRGTLEILRLCEEMEHLKVMLYTSTAYSHCYRKTIEETCYPAPCSPRTIIKFVNEINNDTLNEITSSLLTQGHNTWPNNYTFTKAIAEELIMERQKRLPVAIVRPGIVNCTYNEPVRAWCDNMFGVVGFIAAGMTIMNVTLGNANNKPKLVPADYCMNAHIVAAERVASDFKKNVPTRKTIYNYVPSDASHLSYSEYIALSTENIPKYPLRAWIYPYFLFYTKCTYLYRFLTIILHYLPALLLDLFIMAKGKKPRYINVYKQIDKLSEALRHFTSNTWSMANDNVNNLFNGLNDTDKQLFPFDIDNINHKYWLELAPYGIRKYLLKEPMDEKSLEADRAIYKKMVIVHRTLVTGFYLMVLYFIYYLYTVLLQ
ncbi:waterproof [Carabus blaptoides fortunei]